MTRILNLASMVLLANQGFIQAHADALPPVRIMPLGDSITQGCCSGTSIEGGYRTRLHSLLTGAGYNVDYVGTQTDANNPALPDRDHQGMPGLQIDGLRSSVAIWAKSVEDPDVILLHTGTNDFTAGASVSQVQDRLKSLIADLSELRPHARILVANLIPRTDTPARQSAQATFAAALPLLVNEQVSLGRRVHLVDLNSALDPEDLADGVHPTIVGYEKMADAWLPAITGVISPLGSADAPAISSVEAREDLNHITVKFTKPVEDADVVSTNFNVSNGVVVTGASLDSLSKRVVTLTTSSQQPNLRHTISVSNVHDRTAGHLAISPQSTRVFTSRSIIDGSFESNAQGWSASGNYLIAASTLPATHGSKLLVFNGAQTAPNGSASQSVPTVPGETYHMNFDLGVYGTANIPQSMQITVVGNSTLYSNVENVIGTGPLGTTWTSKSIQFVADSTSATITFHDVSASTNDADLLLDDVRLNAGETTTLTVSSTPTSGLSVTVTPADNNSATNGTTEFTRVYDEGTAVNLTAPATSGTKVFDKWQKDGVNHSTSAATTVTMDTNHTMTAVYRILTNGSFELGSPGDVGTLDGWTVTGNPFGYLSHPTGYVPSEGGRMAVFNGGGNVFNGVISQSFTTVPGQTYTLSFDQGITGASGKKQRVLISVDGTANLLAQFADITATGTPTLWVPRSYTFTADSTTTTLMLSDGSGALSGTLTSTADMMLDNVKVTEPITRTLTVNSSPVTGVAITVSPNDLGANGNGTTNFTRSYSDGTTVTLTAPVSITGHLFQKWQKNGVDLTTSTSTNVIVDADYTLNAVYVVNTAPVANNDSYNATLDTPLTISASGVLGNDTDSEGNPLTAVLVSNVTHGTLTLNANGGFLYTPNTGYTGSDSFTYKANDGGLDSNTATVTITVSAAPTNLVANGSFEVGAVVSGQVTALDNWTVTGNPFGYIADASYTAVDGSRLAVFNGGSNTYGGTVSQVLATVPGATYDVTIHLGIVGTPGRKQRMVVTATGGASLLGQVEDLTAAAGAAQWVTRTYSFVADSASTTLTFTDGSGFWGSNAQAVDMLLDDIEVIVDGSANTAPTAVADSYSTDSNVTLNVSAPGVLSNDTDSQSDPLTAVQVTGPAHGSLTLNSNGSFSYTPTSGYSGADSFTYKANDGSLDSNVVTVSLTVNATGFSGLVNGGFELGTPANVGTLDGWTVTGTGSFPPFGYLTSSPGYVATEGGRLAVFNGAGNVPNGAVAQQFNTTVGETYQLAFDVGVTSPVTSNVQKLQVTVVDSTSGGGGGTLLSQLETVTSTVANTSQWFAKTYTFVATGTQTTLTLADGAGAGASTGDLLLDNVRITVPASNTAPVANNDSYNANQDVALTVSAPGVLGNDTDAQSDPLTSVVVANPTHGTLTLNTNGGFTYTPNSGYSGSDSFTYKANDGSLDSNVATVSITVVPTPVNSITNGSFETGTPANVGSLDGWTVTGSGSFPPFGYLTSAPTYVATDGTRMAVMNGAGNVFDGTISQSFVTVPNQAYTLEFDFGIAASVTNAVQQLTTTVVDSTSGPGGATLLSKQDSRTSTVANVSQWTTKSYTFVATGTQATLKFADNSTLSAHNSDMILDRVRITPISSSFILTVNSTPVTGLAVTVSPSDLAGNANGSTNFARTYSSGAVVSLTATAASGPNVFQKWQKNGVDLTTNTTANVTMDAAYTLTAVYMVDNTPRANADSYVATEDTPLEISAPGVLSNDVEPNALPMTAVLVTPPAHGNLVLNTDGGFTYEPAADYHGADSFVYRASNGTLESANATVTLTVNPANDLPVASGQSVETQEDTPLPVTLAGSDIDGDTLSFVVVDAPAHGVLSGTAPDVTYTPAANFNGSDSFTFKVNDGTADSAVATVSINVTPVGDPPVANGQSLSMTGGTSLAVTLVGSDPDGDPLTYAIVTAPTNGVITGTPPNITYKPTSTFVGSDSFTFKVNDGTTDSAPATVSIAVADVLKNGSFEQVTGTAPTWTPDFWTVSGNYEVSATTVSRPSTDGTKLMVFNSGNRTPNATLIQSFATTPGRPYYLQYDIGIQAFNTSTQKLRVTLTGSSQVMTLDETLVGNSTGTTIWSAKQYQFTANSAVTTLTFTDISPSTIGLDMLLDKVRVVPRLVRGLNVQSSPNSGVIATLTPNDFGGSAGGAAPFSRTYLDGTAVNLSVPAAVGAMNFQKWVRNGVDFSTNPATSFAMSAEYTLNAVYVPNAAPLAGADTYSTDEDDDLQVAAPGVLSNDSDPESVSLTASLVTGPLHGNLTLNSNGSFTYAPDANYNGADSFVYRASDGVVQSVDTTVTLTVDPVNDAPVADANSGSVAEDGTVDVTLSGSDIDGDSLTYAVATQPLHGSVTIAGALATYVPSANYHGTDSFTFTVNDGTVDSAAATVTITVNPVNDAPVASSQSVDVDEDVAEAITLGASDVDLDSLTYTITTPPTNGVLSGDAPNLTYTPNANYHGTDSFTFTVNDGTVDSNEATVTITVNPVNDAPVADSQSVSVNEDGTLNITLTGSDVEGSALTYAVGTPSHGSLSGVAPDLVYTPVANYHGTDSFTFTVNDGTVDSAVATVTITVNPVNDAPVASSQSVDVDEDVAEAITLAASDVDLDSLTYTITTPPTNGVLSGDAPNLTYTPNANYHGADSFAFTVNDGSVDSNEATVTITVNPVNDAPVADAQSVSVNEDGTLNITLTGSDVEGSALTYAVGTPSHGSLSGVAPDLVYTPAANYHGTDSFTFTVNDGTVDSALATVTITVNPVNDAPVASSQSVDVDEDVAEAITLAASDVDLDSLTYTITTPPTNGVLSGDAPNLTYTPNANYHGADSFAFTVNDGTVDSNEATVTITVNPVNDAPVADSQSVSVNEDGTLNITLTGSDVEGSALTYAVGTPSHGSLSGVAPDLVYTPAANYHGTDSFTFTVNDGTVDSAVATVTITVNPVNDAPVASSQSVTLNEDGTLNITLTSSDLDLDSLTYTVGTPSHGVLSGVAPNLVYTPAANYHGTDSFTFTVNDGTVDSAAATVTITVNPVNDAPVADSQSVTVNEDSTLNITLASSDVDLDSLTYTVGTPSHGVLSGVAPNLVYTPAANYHGTDSFTFTVNDGTVDSNEATVAITVNPVNDAPVADSQSVTVNEDGTLNITLTGSDVEGSALTYAVGTPSHGSLSGVAPNLVYTPAANYHGTDSFTFTVNDGTVDSAAATVTITVNPVNDAPVADSQSVTVNEDGTLNITLASSDVDLDSLTYMVGTPSHGVLSGVAPNLVYTPAANYHGTDSFTFTVNDGTVDSAAATVTITVNPVNDAPVADSQSVSVNEDGTLNITLTGSDVEGSALTYAVGTPSHGALSGVAPNLVYTPVANYHGTDSFTFTVNDGTVDSAAATVSITVEAVNDAPVANGQIVSVNEDGAVNITLTGSDVESTGLNFAVSVNPLHGTLSGSVPNLVYTPVANYHGADSFTFTVNDGRATSAPATVSITVNPVNDAPVANSQSVTANEDGTLNITLTGSDIDLDSLTYTVGTPSHGSLSGVAPTLVYTPAANYHGADSFTFTVNDGTVDSAAATVAITVNPVNDVPVADSQSVTVNEDSSVNITLTSSDADLDSLTYTVGTPSHGVLSGVAPDLVYTPAANYHGTDSFTFTVNDGTVDSAVATVTITVDPVNDIPVANAQSVSVDENDSVAVTLTGSDVEGSTLSYAVTTVPSHGTLSGTAPNLTYTPNSNYSGSDSFAFTVSDGTDTSTPATVSITVNSATPEFTKWMAEFGLTAGPNVDSDSDTIRNGVEYVIGGNPANQSNTNLLPITTIVTADPDNDTISSNYVLFTYRRTDRAHNDPLTTIKAEWNGGFTGPWTDAATTSGVVILEDNDAFGPGVDRVRVYLPRTLTSNGLLFVRLNVVVNVAASNQAPVAQNQSVSVNEDGSVLITLTAVDANGDPLSYSVATSPSHGALTGNGNTRTYTPAPNYHGPDSFTFTANDGTASSAPATVSITVNSQEEYNQWLAGFGLTAGPGVDSDGDSISNGIEYVIGGNPASQNNTVLLPTITLVNADPDNNLVSSDYLLFTYRRTDLAKNDPSATIKVEWSTSLTSGWTNTTGTSGVVVIEQDDAAGAGVDLVQVYIPRSLAVNGRLFARLVSSVATP